MVSTAQLISFLERTESEVDLPAPVEATQSDEDIINDMKKSADVTLNSMRQELETIRERMIEIENTTRNRNVWVSKGKGTHPPTEASDNPKGKFQSSVTSFNILVKEFERELQYAQSARIEEAENKQKRSALIPVWIIGGVSIFFGMFGATMGEGLGFGTIIPTLIPIALAWGAVEVRGNSEGFVAAMTRLVYILIGAIYFLGYGLLAFAALALAGSSCRGQFFCFRDLGIIILPFAGVLFLVATWMLWKGLSNKLPLPRDKQF